MKIIGLSFFPGRNVYSHRPVMKMLLDLQSHQFFRTDQDPLFAKKLIKILPGLKSHYCSRRRPGGFIERLADGTYLGHVVEHVFLELQEQVGIGTDYGKTMRQSDGLVEMIAEYRCREAAEYLAKEAVMLVAAALKGEAREIQVALCQAKKLAAEFMPGPSTAAVLAAARKRHIPAMQMESGTSLYRLGTGKYQKRIMASISDLSCSIAVDISCSKPLTTKLLSEQGFSVPRGEVVRSAEEALLAVERIGYPVAIKPDNGNQGKGVFLNLKTPEEIKKAFSHAVAYSPNVLVEEYIHGRHYRLLVVNGEMVAAAERIPAHVVGDGKTTVLGLIEEENNNPLRGFAHEKPLTRIVLDDLSIDTLARQGLRPEDIPEEGRLVWLRENANLSTGGIARDVTDEVHPQFAEQAIRAVRTIGLDIAGVDLVTEDINKPPEQQHGSIIEINAAPGLRMHLCPTAGKRRDVGEKIVDMLFPPGTPCRVPVFSVTGTNGKTSTVRMLEYAMRKHGLTTGMCCTTGVYIHGCAVQAGDMTGPSGAGAILGNREVEVAVLETARGGIIRRGLGYDRADVAVLTNIRSDHLGQDGIETLDDLLHVKSLVVEAVYPSGAVILNADEPHVHSLLPRIWAEVIFVSSQSQNIIVRRHLGKGGRAVFVRRGAILAAHGSRVALLGRTREFAVTMGGKNTYQTENLLSALAACWGFGLSPRQAAAYLKSFASNAADNPGRANLYRVGNFRVLVDYGHNPDGMIKTGELVGKLKPEKSIAVVGVPGDRRNDLIIEAGEAVARHFDTVIIKEDADLRGRNPGEVASLLLQGALSVTGDKQAITVEYDESRAFEKAMDMAGSGDVVVVFYENLNGVLEAIKNRGGREMALSQACPEKLRAPMHMPRQDSRGYRRIHPINTQ